MPVREAHEAWSEDSTWDAYLAVQESPAATRIFTALRCRWRLAKLVDLQHIDEYTIVYAVLRQTINCQEI